MRPGFTGPRVLKRRSSLLVTDMAWFATSGIVSPLQLVDMTDSLEFRPPEGTEAVQTLPTVADPMVLFVDSTDAAEDE